MNYAEIKYNDIANGIGVRTSLFVSGCTHHCKECFNPMTWDFAYGKVFNKEVEDAIIESLKPSYISGLTMLGGEPMEPFNQEALLPFYKRVRSDIYQSLYPLYIRDPKPCGYPCGRRVRIGEKKSRTSFSRQFQSADNRCSRNTCRGRDCIIRIQRSLNRPCL